MISLMRNYCLFAKFPIGKLSYFRRVPALHDHLTVAYTLRACGETTRGMTLRETCPGKGDTMRHLLKLTVLVAGFLMLIPALGSAQEGAVFLELDDLLREGIPGNCSTWHELFPAHCTPRHQSDYEDNGDGMLSACDIIYLDGDRYHIEWVGPTYWLDCDIITEPMGDSNPGDPVCEEWIEVWPNHGVVRHVIGWEDNGDGVVSPCDIIYFHDGLICHIQDIGTNIRVNPDGSAAEESTWSRIKGMFSGMF